MSGQLLSLHAKAAQVIPDLGAKPSTIAVAILHEDKLPSEDLQQDDFLWVKCNAKIDISRIHQQYENKRPDSGCTSWVLKLQGNPVDLGGKIGDLNNQGNNIVVFEAMKVVVDGQKPTLSHAAKAEPPLSPKDPNARPPVTAASQKVLPPVDGDENSVPRPSWTVSPTTTHLEPPSQVHVNPASPSPQSTPATTMAPTRMFANIQQPLSNDHITQPAENAVSSRTSLDPRQPLGVPPINMAIDDGDQSPFWRFHTAWIERYKVAYPKDDQDQLGRRLWSSWLSMGETERQDYRFGPVPTTVKAEDTLGLSRTESINPSSTQMINDVVQPPISAAEMKEQQQKPFHLPAEMKEQQQKPFHLPNLLKDATPQVLEASVEASLELLNTIRAPLVEKMANSPDAEQWIQQIDNLKKQAIKTKTVIGVVGNTGAGKSSVINAMLDEERLVPTNCMRACTAVVTEISYNYEEQPYCAEIEFISSADWEKELNVLFQDLFDSDGKVSRDCANEDTDAGVAYAKIKAVYPQKTKEDIANTSIQTMLKDVSSVLGSTRNIKEEDSLMFYKKLQSYVDSKEKSTGKKDKDGKKEKREREFWPLIRVVRLYVRSQALKTGAVIVDLPGVHDSNAARAAVAEGYMKQCTGLWIVAPINRAVDDKAAKSLLGESFKRQLKMDGGFSAVTFICSKTDDISLMEAQDSLGLDEQMAPSWDEIDRLSAKQKDFKKQLEQMRETKTVYEDAANDADEQIEVWETIRESVNEGKTVFAANPRSASKKRKGGSIEKLMKKKRKTAASDSGDSDFIHDGDNDKNAITDSGGEESDHGSETDGQEPLTEEQVTTKLQELRAVKKDGRLQKKELTDRMSLIRKEIQEAKDEEAKIESRMSAMCISGRNQYSRGAIQQDFAAGIKELDQEIAAEEDEENFNPDVEIRDYDEVAKGLSVFCVSSRGYQKLSGRLRKDPPVAGFTTIGETEIPQLQKHCEKLTETGRAANCRAFINRLSQLLNSLTLWASRDGTGANLTAEQKAREANYLQKGLEGLESSFEKATKTTARELASEFEDSIFDHFETAVSNASQDSISTALQWGAPVNRENRAEGGLFWASYKAVCRRDGCFTNAQGLHDWNAQLIEPLIKVVAPGWEKAFTRRVQVVMNNFTRNVSASLKKFHHDIEGRARKIGAGIAGFSMLSQQIGVYEQILKDLAMTTKDMIITRQKDINREFVPLIELSMQSAYAWCTSESGSGSFARMKAHMNSHVAETRHTMFQDSTEEVKRQLSSLVKDVEDALADKADEVFIQIQRDYRSVLGGREAPQDGEVLPRVQRQVRREVARIIEGIEKMMRKVVGLDVEEDAELGEETEEAGNEEVPSAEGTQTTEAGGATSTGLRSKPIMDGSPEIQGSEEGSQPAYSTEGSRDRSMAFDSESSKHSTTSTDDESEDTSFSDSSA